MFFIIRKLTWYLTTWFILLVKAIPFLVLFLDFNLEFLIIVPYQNREKYLAKIKLKIFVLVRRWRFPLLLLKRSIVELTRYKNQILKGLRPGICRAANLKVMAVIVKRTENLKFRVILVTKGYKKAVVIILIDNRNFDGNYKDSSVSNNRELSLGMSSSLRNDGAFNIFQEIDNQKSE